MKNKMKRTFKHLALGLVLAAGLTTAAKASLVGLPDVYPGYSPTAFTPTLGGVAVGNGAQAYLPLGLGTLTPIGNMTSSFSGVDAHHVTLYSGTLTSDAYRDGTGTLIAFILTQTYAHPASEKIINLTLDYYATTADKVGYGIGNGLLVPGTMTSGPHQNNNDYTWEDPVAGVLNVSYDPGLGVGNSIEVLLYSPDPYVLPNWATVQDGTTSGNIKILSTVPEPTTMIAGALLLLPFGASTLRILRRRQQVR